MYNNVCQFCDKKSPLVRLLLVLVRFISGVLVMMVGWSDMSFSQLKDFAKSKICSNIMPVSEIIRTFAASFIEVLFPVDFG